MKTIRVWLQPATSSPTFDELSHWLIALMNDGKYNGKQILPADVLKATLQPAIALPNVAGESQGYWELLNSAMAWADEPPLTADI